MAVALAGALAASSYGWKATGTVSSTAGSALQGVAISVKDSVKYVATTDATGAFLIEGSTGVGTSALRDGFSVMRDGSELVVRYPGQGALEISLVDLSGATLWKSDASLLNGVARFTIPASSGMGTEILKFRHGGDVLSRVVILRGTEGWRVAPQPVASRSLADAFPVLLFKKSGFKPATYSMTSETVSGLSIKMVPDPGIADWAEDHRSECAMPKFPAASTVKDNKFLPDPFTMFDGTKVTTMAQWKCRREEMAAMIEFYELGEKPRNPEKVTGSFSGNTLTVNVTDKGKSLSFTVSISKPAGAGPFPAIIGFGGGNLGSSYSGMGVATISYTGTDLAADAVAHGGGKFYTMYGNSATAGSLIGWAWGISRVIDALAVTPAAGIDVKRLGVTGCSRYGKGALVAGAYDQRIALTIPQEAGGGGCSSWRVIAAEKAAGQNIEQFENISTGSNWMGSMASANYKNSTTAKMPFDHHWLGMVIAPRGFLHIENTIDWLGPNASFITNNAVREAFVAVGAPEAHTYSLTTGHNHCALPASQNHWVQSYVKKYLLGQTGEASKIEAPATHKYDKTKWVDWTTPALN